MTQQSVEILLVEDNADDVELTLERGEGEVVRFAERFVQTLKLSVLDRMIFFGEAALRRAVREFVEHYYPHERNHQGIGNKIPAPGPGTIKELKVKVGDRVSQGSVILTLDAAEDAAKSETAPAAKLAPRAHPFTLIAGP